jgi:hypothetical protein
MSSVREMRYRRLALARRWLDDVRRSDAYSSCNRLWLDRRRRMLEAVSLSPIEFTATTAFLANALEVSPTGTTASHRGSLEILYTIATVQAHNGSAITPTTMTGRHLTGMAILPILVTARGAIRLSIKCIATELVDYSGGTEAPTT